ncbi:deaminase [Mycobacterium tuberculosis]|nr:deaminase [Mycobacterium tuberculosis]
MAGSLPRFTATRRARPGLTVGSTLDGGPNGADDARWFLVACEVDRGVVVTLVRDRTAVALPFFVPADVLHMPAGMAGFRRWAQTNDPTAHAESLAIRAACTKLGTEHLVGTTLNVLAHPCPMCYGSLYYCSPDEVVFLTSRDAYEPHYVDDRRYFEPATFYDEFAKEWQDRRLPMRQEHRPDIRAGAVDVYRFRQEPNGGERSAIAAPTG